MNLRRIFILLGKEVLRGSNGFLIIFAIVIPFAITLLINLLFGSFFSGKAKLGIVDEGSSALVTLAHERESLIVKDYETTAALRQAVESGAVDMGVALPAGFDAQVTGGEEIELTAFLWGESELKDRAVLGASLAVMIRQMAGQEAPVEIVTTTLGDTAALPWEERLMPFIVLMTVLMGGIMVPATSLVDEKQKRTLTALTTTPVGLGEVFSAKAGLGVILSMVMGVTILLLNHAFGAQPLLLLLVLLMGAVMAAIIGILLGALLKDINSLFAAIKGLGLLLYAPAIVYMFPAVPQWIGKLFPTYYMIQPVVEITQQGGGFSDVAPELGVLLVEIILLIGVAAALIQRAGHHEVAGLNTA